MKTEFEIKRSNSFIAFHSKGVCGNLCLSRTANPTEGVREFCREIEDLVGYARKPVYILLVSIVSLLFQEPCTTQKTRQRRRGHLKERKKIILKSSLTEMLVQPF